MNSYYAQSNKDEYYYTISHAESPKFMKLLNPSFHNEFSQRLTNKKFAYLVADDGDFIEFRFENHHKEAEMFKQLSFMFFDDTLGIKTYEDQLKSKGLETPTDDNRFNFETITFMTADDLYIYEFNCDSDDFIVNVSNLLTTIKIRVFMVKKFRRMV